MHSPIEKETFRERREQLLESFVWVKLKDPSAFNIVRETLTRIGLPAFYDSNGHKLKEQKLIQSCHLLHKNGRYAIAHFKEMIALDGIETSFSEEDRQRRNTIVQLLMSFDNLITVENPDMIKDQLPANRVKIIPHAEKKNWKLVSKYVNRSKFAHSPAEV